MYIYIYIYIYNMRTQGPSQGAPMNSHEMRPWPGDGRLTHGEFTL